MEEQGRSPCAIQMLRIRGAKRSEAEYIRENEGEKTKKRHRVFSVVTDTKPFERDWRGNKCLRIDISQEIELVSLLLSRQLLLIYAYKRL